MNTAAYDFFQKIWILDESKFNDTLLDALSRGRAVIHDGVAYWAEGSGKTGVIQHLPFKEAAFKSAEEAIKAAQMTTVIATAASTCVILGAIIIQTKYLAAKLVRLQEAVDEISKDVHSQNIIYYMDKITDYVGGIEVARTLLRDRSLAEEVREVAYPLLAQLSAKRNHVFSFIDNILNLASSKDDVTERHYELIVNFAHMTMEIMPMGIHTEYLLTARVGKPRLAEQILVDGAQRYENALNVYKGFMNEQHASFVRGNIGARARAYKGIEPKVAALLHSTENELLLSLPMGRMALQAA